MAKRNSKKRKKSSPRIKGNISRQQHNRLRKEANNARRRIRVFSKRSDSSLYFVPEPNDYTLETLLQRISLGESYKSVMNELRNLTAAKIKSGVSFTLVSDTGYKLKPSEVRLLSQAVSSANKNITEARKKFSDFTDILPTEFSLKQLSQNATSAEYIRNKVQDLALFTPENLIPTAVNDDGVAGTIAEYSYYRNILNRENERREKQRLENNPTTNKGYFRQQNDYDTDEINIDSFSDLESMKRRAETWDDPARLYRANLYLTNYEKALDMFAGVLINNGYWNSVIEDRVEYIRDVMSKLYFNEKAITYASTRMPNIDISLLYSGGQGDVDFASIYNTWCEIEDMFL